MKQDRPWAKALEEWEAAGRLRSLRRTAREAGGRIRRGGGPALLDFSSNDSLGLSRHPALIERAQAWAAAYGVGAGASRLVTGNLEQMEGIEEKIAAAKGTEAALLFPSGWQANASVLPALFDGKVHGAEPLVFADRLNHASLHHGCAAAGVRQIRYRHLDLGHLEALVRKHAASPAPKFIVSETVFSMDGDQADVAGLVEIAERHGAVLYLDEAHATGVLGPRGFGLAAAFAGRVDLVMGTCSKALGSQGAYVACSAELRAYLLNRSSGFVYSTALAPPLLGAIDAALDLLPTLDEARARLHRHASTLRGSLAAMDLDTGGSSTHIVPVLLGSEERALEVARALEDRGFLGIAIRPPTVPAGTSRIRLSLSAAHGEEDVAALIGALGEVTRT
jgi:8-amino-7-oxononanoate synthase